MGLLGEGFDDPKTSAIMNLSAGLLQGDLGAGLLGANNAFAQAKQNAAKQQFMQMQMAEMQQQAELRKQQAAHLARRNTWIESMLNPTANAAAVQGANDAVIAKTGNLAPTNANAAIQSQALQSSSPFGGLPREAVQADLMFNDGKGIAEWMFKRGVPDMQVANGYAYDKNTVKPGFLPGLNIANDGRGTVTLPGADGIPRMSAMPGSVESFAAFEDAKNNSAAGVRPIKVYNPATQREEFRSERDVTQPTPAAPMRTGNPALVSGANDLRSTVAGLEATLADAKPGSALYTRTLTDIQNAKAELSRMPGGGIAAGPTSAEQTAQQVDREAALGRQKQIMEQRQGIMNGGMVAPGNISRYQQIGKLLQDVDGGRLTPVGTELASALNSAGIKVDKNLPNKEAAAAMANQAALELRNPAGGAGMPGAMSDADRQFLASMTPNMAQSAQGRAQVINAYVAVQQRNMQVADFARKYEKKYGKLDNGFFDQLQQWSNSNPMFKAQ